MERGVKCTGGVGFGFQPDGAEGPGGEQLAETGVERFGVEPIALQVGESTSYPGFMGFLQPHHLEIGETLAFFDDDDEPRREPSVTEDAVHFEGPQQIAGPAETAL